MLLEKKILMCNVEICANLEKLFETLTIITDDLLQSQSLVFFYF